MQHYARETILYEIAMAIGNSLSLDVMCRMALQAFVKKLGATSGLITEEWSEHAANEQSVVASIPRRNPEMKSFQALLDQIGESDEQQPVYYLNTGQHIYAFPLQTRDVLLLSRTQPLDGLILRSLPPLLQKLAVAIQACRDNAQLEQSLLTAREAERAKSAFLANMSHEIRTPMNAILGFVQLLAATEQDESRQKQFTIIKNSGKNLLNIINDILDLSKIESGNLQIERRAFNISDLLIDAHALFKVSADEKSITLTVDTSKDVPAIIVADAVRIKQVLYNLLSNAIKFTDVGGRVDVIANYSDDVLTLRVTDTGIGINADKLEKIFDAFAQEDDSTTREFGGTGLGLSISTRLVQLMNGSLAVKSRKGEGSSFEFSIPAPSARPAPTDRPNGTIDDCKKSVSGKGRVLVVEDDDMNRQLLAQLLTEHEVAFDMAQDGNSALTMTAAAHYDLILMDENMPGLSGIETAHRILEAQRLSGEPATPIVAVTANALRDDRQRFIDAGMADYLAKPYENGEMIALIRKYIATG